MLLPPSAATHPDHSLKHHVCGPAVLAQLHGTCTLLLSQGPGLLAFQRWNKARVILPI